MSLFIGKVSNTAMLHITNTSNNSNELQSLTNISSTVFHSANTFLTVRLVERVTSYTTVYDGTWRRSLLFNLSAESIALVNSGNFFAMGVNSLGNYTHNFGTQKVDGLNYGGHAEWNFASLYYANAYIGFGQLIRSAAIVGSPYVDIYTYDILTPPSGSRIELKNGTVKIGNIDFLDHSFLTLGSNNSYDTEYPLEGSTGIQILNSRKNNNESISLDGDGIYTVEPNGTRHLLFGNLTSANIMQVDSVSFSNVTSVTLPAGDLILITLPYQAYAYAQATYLYTSYSILIDTAVSRTAPSFKVLHGRDYAIAYIYYVASTRLFMIYQPPGDGITATAVQISGTATVLKS